MRSLLVLLLFLPIAAVSVQAQGPTIEGSLVLELSDVANDVTLNTAAGSSPGLPNHNLVDRLDLVRLRILDPDEETLVFELQTKAPFPKPPTGYSGSWATGFDQQIWFKVPGQGGIKVQAMIQVDNILLISEEPGQQQQEPILAGVDLCYGATEYGCQFWDTRPTTMEVVDGKLLIRVPKTSFLRSDEHRVTSRTAALPMRLRAGDEFTDVFVKSRSGTPLDALPAGTLRAEMGDRMPNAGLHTFKLRFDSPTSDIRISGWPRAVVAGEETTLALEVTNLASNKRIINLSADVLRTDDDEGPWTVKITPSVTLNAGKGTNITLRVGAPALGADHNAWAQIRIRGQVLTEPGTVAVSLASLAAEPALDATHNTYYAHGNTYTRLPVGVPLYNGWSWGSYTRFEEEPLYGDTPMKFNSFTSLTPQAYMHLWASPIPNTAVLRPSEPIKNHLELEADLPATGTLVAQMRLGDMPLGDVTRTVAFQRGRTGVDLEFTPPATSRRLDPANGTLTVLYRLNLNQPEAAANGLSMLNVYVVPKLTQIKLPVDREFPIVASRPSIQVVLAPTEDLTSFVNPGRVVVYELDLRNEDTKAASVMIEAENVTEGWTATVKPSGRFRLEPADAAHVGVLVRAPGGAAEGATSAIRLLAKDALTGEVLAGQWLRTIVTSGVEVPNETFEVRAEDASKIVAGPKGSSPALSVGVFLVACAGVALWRRR